MSPLKDLFLVLVNNFKKGYDEFIFRVRFKFPFKQLRDIKYWIRHRTFDRYNKIEIISLEPGYYDKDVMMLHGMFDLLVDFIEGELAWMKLICSDEEKSKVPWWMSFKKYRNKHARELGLKYIDWAMTLTMDICDNGEPKAGSDLQINHEGTQGWCAKEQKELYLWWKDQRQKEWDAHWEEPYIPGSEQWKKEEALNEKDEEMLIRLIKIRHSLWT